MNNFYKSQSLKILQCYTNSSNDEIEKALPIGHINKNGYQKQPDGSWKYVSNSTNKVVDNHVPKLYEKNGFDFPIYKLTIKGKDVFIQKNEFNGSTWWTSVEKDKNGDWISTNGKVGIETLWLGGTKKEAIAKLLKQ